jgi:hypothetical protein
MKQNKGSKNEGRERERERESEERNSKVLNLSIHNILNAFSIVVCPHGFLCYCLLIYMQMYINNVGPVAQSVQRLATGWTVRGSNWSLCRALNQGGSSCSYNRLVCEVEAIERE